MIKNRPLTKDEKDNLHPFEQKVVYCYEKTTKNKFMRYELISLKRLFRFATPEQINATIFRMYKLYPQNFKNFFYIVQPVENMFKNRRGGKK